MSNTTTIPRGKYMRSIYLRRDMNNLKKDFGIDMLRPITLLVGDQGVGKSTLLNAIQQCDTEAIMPVMTVEGRKGVDTSFFDFEKMNPRVVDPHTYSNIKGQSIGFGFGNAIAARMLQSHGEVSRLMSIDGLKQASDCMIIFDEPEAGLSLRSQYEFTKEAEEAVKRGCQLFIATHSMPIIQSQEVVYSMEHQEWLRSEDFIASQGKKRYNRKRLPVDHPLKKQKPIPNHLCHVTFTRRGAGAAVVDGWSAYGRMTPEGTWNYEEGYTYGRRQEGQEPTDWRSATLYELTRAIKNE